MIDSLAEDVGFSRDKTSICVSRLVSAGLVRTLSLYGGTGYELSDLGQVVLDVLLTHRSAIKS